MFFPKKACSEKIPVFSQKKAFDIFLEMKPHSIQPGIKRNKIDKIK